MTRRSLTPTAARIPGLLPQRRSGGGARIEATDRVHLALGDGVGGSKVSLEGWALNVSRGGIRLIVDGASIEGATDPTLALSKLLELGRPMTITMGEEETDREGRIVWVQEEPDGAVIGVAFADAGDSGVPPPLPEDGSRGSDPGAP